MFFVVSMIEESYSEPISVVIPLYNKESTIFRALESVLSQTILPYEIIIVNDGSTDESEKIAAEYSSHYSNIFLINQENSGVSCARNRGIASAKGELIAFLDADDEWDKEYLATILSLRMKYPDAGLYATAYYQADSFSGKKNLIQYKNLPNSANLLPSYYEAISLGPHPIMTSGIVIPKNILDNFGGFEVGLSMGEDLLLWAKIALEYPVAYSSEPLSTCWINAENNHTITTKKKERASERIPFAEYYKSWRNTSLKQYESDASVYLYLSYLLIIQAQEFAAVGEKRKAYSILRQVKGRKLFLKKCGCFLYIFLPIRIFRMVLKITGKFTQIGQTL